MCTAYKCSGFAAVTDRLPVQGVLCLLPSMCVCVCELCVLSDIPYTGRDVKLMIKALQGDR